MFLSRRLPSLVATVVCLACTVTNSAELNSSFQADLSKLVRETQMSNRDGDALTLVWWMPQEFWQASMAQTKAVDDSLKAQTIGFLRPYTVVAVVSGNVGPLGGMTFVSDDSIRAIVRLTDAQGSTYTPVPAESVEVNASTLLQLMAPVMANMIGPLGKNMRFLVFPALTKDSLPIAEATSPGSFNFVVGGKEFKWRLPLASLVPPKVCQKCSEECSGVWKFCPWCGTKLE